MKPEIIHLTQLTLAGLNYFGDPFQISADWTEENEIGRLWTRLMGFLLQNKKWDPQQLHEESFYEVHIYNKDTLEKGIFDVFVGFEIYALEDIPMELLIRVLPSSTYAVFPLKGQQIKEDWSQMIYQDWLPKLGYKSEGRLSIQKYDQRFKGLDRIEESEIDVLIPVYKDN